MSLCCLIVRSTERKVSKQMRSNCRKLQTNRAWYEIERVLEQKQCLGQLDRRGIDAPDGCKDFTRLTQGVSFFYIVAKLTLLAHLHKGGYILPGAN